MKHLFPLLILCIFSSELKAEPPLKLTGFFGNKLVELNLPSEMKILYEFEYPLLLDGYTKIDENTMVFSTNEELFLFDKRSNKRLKLGVGWEPSYNPNTKELFYFTSSLKSDGWWFYLNKSKLTSSGLFHREVLSQMPKYESSGRIYFYSDNRLIFQVGGAKVYEWNQESKKLRVLPVNNCALRSYRIETKSIICSEWGSNSYKEVSLENFNEKKLEEIKGGIGLYIANRDIAIGSVVRFSIFKGEYVNLFIYDFKTSNGKEFKNLGLTSVVWSN